MSCHKCGAEYWCMCGYEYPTSRARSRTVSCENCEKLQEKVDQLNDIIDELEEIFGVIEEHKRERQ